MKIYSADTEPHYDLDFARGTLRIVEDSSFRITLLVEENKKNVIILSVKEVD